MTRQAELATDERVALVSQRRPEIQLGVITPIGSGRRGLCLDRR